MRKYFTIGVIITSFFALSCNSTGSNSPAGNGSKSGEAKRGVAPQADSEIAVIEMEDPAFGPIKIELYPNIAPKMVARFKELIKEGFYDGTTFHRVDPTLGIIQGGDPNSKDSDPANDGQGSSTKPAVQAEFSDILYDSAIVGAARTQVIDSANCQFFITLKRQPAFDNKYTIFGKVVEGLDKAKRIAGAPAMNSRPTSDIRIKKVTLQTN